MISIALASNNNYAVLMAALIKSIIVNHHSGEEITFYLLNDKISKSSQAKINSLVVGFPKIYLIWKTSKEVFPSDFKLPVDGSAFPEATYLRLYAPYIVAKGVKKLIYFDVDMIVTTDVSELWNTDLKGCTIAAVQDVGRIAGCKWGGIPNYKALGIDENALYANTGMMIIDCEKWILEDIPSQVLKAMRENIEHVNYADQYGLNVVFSGKWLPVDPMWNWFANNYHPKPKCIHYLDVKPIFTSYNSDKVLREEFFKYLEMTPWRGMSLRSGFGRLAKKAIVKIQKKVKALFS